MKIDYINKISHENYLKSFQIPKDGQFHDIWV
jgi:hypothetical protein